MSRRKSGLVWRGFEMFPLRYAFCPSDEAWAAEMKILGEASAGIPAPTSDGACSRLESGAGDVIAIVTMRADAARYSTAGLIGILIHEAVHVWQMLCEDIGEDAPSSEFEAYAVQCIAQTLIEDAVKAGRIGALP